MDIFILTLPNDQQEINFAADDPAQLQRAIHKFLGAVGYTGLPRLARATESVATTLREGGKTDGLLGLLNIEITTVLDWHQGNREKLPSILAALSVAALERR